MEILVKIAAVSLLGACTGMLLRRSNPELTVPIGALVCAFALFALSDMLVQLKVFADEAAALSSLSAAYVLPVLKCTVIGIAAKVAADLCRDAGQGAMAGAVDLGGAVAAVCVSLPLLRSFLTMLQGLL